MKKLVVLAMLCCTLFCVCAIASGIGRERRLPFITSFPTADYTNTVSSSSVAVSGEVITHLDIPTVTTRQDSSALKKNKEDAKVQIVTDLTGRKRKLRLGDVDTSNKEVLIHTTDGLDSLTGYAQVADGHYYYLRQEGERRYTLYCDKGDRIGRFWIDKWYYFIGCCKYGDRFYVILYHEDHYPGVTTDKYFVLTVADFSKGELRILREIEEYVADYFEMYFYKDKIRVYESLGEDTEYDDEEDEGKEFSNEYSMTGKEEPVINLENRDYIMDGSRYYARGKGGEVRIFRENMKNKKVEEIFRYRTKQKVTSSQKLGIRLDVDEKDMFITEYSFDERYRLYIVPRSGGEMKLVTDKLYDEEEYTYNSQYIFWREDDYNRIHIWNRKTQKEERMIEPPLNFKDDLTWELNCTEEGLYIQECGINDRKSARPGYNLYYKGFNEEKFETVWDDKKYFKEEEYEE